MSPTNASLGRLDPRQLSQLDRDGRHTAGPAPTKEAWLHLAMYRQRPGDAAVVHLHSAHAVALSCRTDRPADDMVPALTPYIVMRVGRVARVPYQRPGDTSLLATFERLAAEHRALLLAHGPVVAGSISMRPSRRRRNWRKPPGCFFCWKAARTRRSAPRRSPTCTGPSVLENRDAGRDGAHHGETRFRDAVSRASARAGWASLANERACTRFDVCHDPSRSSILLFEIYDDAEAFQSHLATRTFSPSIPRRAPG